MLVSLIGFRKEKKKVQQLTRSRKPIASIKAYLCGATSQYRVQQAIMPPTFQCLGYELHSKSISFSFWRDEMVPFSLCVTSELFSWHGECSTHVSAAHIDHHTSPPKRVESYVRRAPICNRCNVYSPDMWHRWSRDGNMPDRSITPTEKL